MDRIILFDLHKETFGFELGYVKEVIDDDYIKPVPLTPPFICGVLNRRGTFLTIINLAMLFGSPPEHTGQDVRIIVLDHKEMDIGLLVNNIRGTKPISLPGKEQTPDNIIDGGKRRFHKLVLKNVGNREKVTILDVAKLLNFLWDYRF